MHPKKQGGREEIIYLIAIKVTLQYKIVIQ